MASKTKQTTPAKLNAKSRSKNQSQTRRQTKSKALILHPYPEKVLSSQDRRYRLALENQARFSEQLRVFVEVDRPKYESWVQLNFAALILKGLEQTAILEDLEDQLNAIAFHSETFGISPSKSAKLIFKEREKGSEALHLFMETVEAERKHENEGEDGVEVPPHDRHWDGEEDERIEDLFRDIFERSGSSPWGREEPETPSEEYYKAIYRECARLIHPDVSGPENFNEELWNELQTAYAHRDFARLESLRARIRSPESSDKPLGAGEIASLRVLVERKMRELKRDISASKSDPAWAFSERSQNPKHLKKLSQELRMVFMLDLRDIEDQIEILKYELDQFRPKRSRSAPPKPAKKASKAPPSKRRPAR